MAEGPILSAIDVERTEMEGWSTVITSGEWL